MKHKPQSLMAMLKKSKSKKKNKTLFLASLKDIIVCQRGSNCMHGANSLPGWSSLLSVTPGRASRGRELVRRSWWRKKKTKLKRHKYQINVVWHSYHPQPLSDSHWLQELLLWGQTEASALPCKGRLHGMVSCLCYPLSHSQKGSKT